MKGAPERILDICNTIFINGEEKPLDNDTATTRGLLRLSPATATATTSPRTAMVTRTATATTRGLLGLSPAMATATTSPRTAMATPTATATTRGLLRLSPATAMATSPRTAMATTATATTKLFQKEY